MTLTESAVRSSLIDLNTDHLCIMAMKVPIGSRLSLQVSTFVVGGVAQAIQVREPITCG